MMKMCRKIPVFCQENRKAWLEKHNAMVKHGSVTPESSLIGGSSLFSNNLSLRSISDHQAEQILTARNICGRVKVSPTRILYQHMKPELKEEDKKILRLMALRREEAIKDEELAHSVRSMWAEERKQYTKTIEERKKSWNEYIAQKRRMESLRNCLRKKNQIDTLKEEKILLESRINEKHEKSQRRKKEISAQKKPDTVTSSAEEMLHRQLRKQQEWEESVRDAVKAKYYEDKSKRAEEKLKLILTEKLRRLKEASLKRDVKWQAAKDFRDEMNRKSEELRMENLKREEAYQAMREYRVANAIEWKRKMALEKNQMKKEYHSFIYNKLKEQEREKETQARLYLAAKEQRMKALQEKKEMAISRSRSSSRMAASLRQIIKSSHNI